MRDAIRMYAHISSMNRARVVQHGAYSMRRAARGIQHESYSTGNTACVIRTPIIMTALPPISANVQLATSTWAVPSRYSAAEGKMDQSPVPGAIDLGADVPPRKVTKDWENVIP